jgi:hypothetical protein
MLTSGTPFSRREGRRHPVDDHVGAAAGDHLFRSDVGAARLDRDIKAFLFVKALVLGDIVARELRLRDPFELQRQLVGCLRAGQPTWPSATGCQCNPFFMLTFSFWFAFWHHRPACFGVLPPLVSV